MFQKCSLCNLKPATLTCTACQIILCSGCEDQKHSDKDHETRVIVLKGSDNTEHSITIDNSRQSVIAPSNVGERLKYQELNNRVEMLKQHIQKQEQQYELNLHLARQEKLILEEKFHQFQSNVDQSKHDLIMNYECQIERLKVQLEADKQARLEMQDQLDQRQLESEARMRALKKEAQEAKEQMEIMEQNFLDRENQQKYSEESFHSKSISEQSQKKLVDDLRKQLREAQKESKSKDQIIKQTQEQITQLQFALKQSLAHNEEMRHQQTLDISDMKIVIKEKDAEILSLHDEVKGYKEILKNQSADIAELKRQITDQKQTEIKLKKNIDKLEKWIYGKRK